MRINRRGMVLIFAMWVLAFLTILAVSVAAGIRQKIVLVKRLDERSRMVYVLEASVKKSIALIRKEMNQSGFLYTPELKMALHNNTNELSRIVLRGDTAEVGLRLGEDEQITRFGVSDEESKINLNTTDKTILKNLILRVTGLKDDEASKLADALLDWRLWGQSQAAGFFSDEYYANLKHPYKKKDANYETLDEMLLVKGMTKEIFDVLINYVTIYGDGKVNINTASPAVLSALGLDDVLVGKILEVRKGKDELEATGDDHVFYKTFDVATEVKAVVKLDMAEIHAIDMLNAQGLLGVSSFYFSIHGVGRLKGRTTSNTVDAVYSLKEDKILYWRQS